MAKGSLRKKGKKWYYRFYVKDENGKLVQKEFAGSTSREETEKMLYRAIEEYERKKDMYHSGNITLGNFLDIWAEEDLKTSTLSNSTVTSYLRIIGRIRKNPISEMKMVDITSIELQQFMDFLTFGGKRPDGTYAKAYSKDYVCCFSAVLQSAFRFAVFPKGIISFNPMQYVTLKKKTERIDIFSTGNAKNTNSDLLGYKQYLKLIDYLKEHNPPVVLPIQIAYFTGLRIGEICGLTWQDINLREQYLVVQRSVRYNSVRHRIEIGPTKQKRVRTVDFGTTLRKILSNAKKQQQEQKQKLAPAYLTNYYREIWENNRVYYELYHTHGTERMPDDGSELSLVCIRPNGAYESASAIETACQTVKKKVPGLQGFHFHALRHTYTTNLLASGAQPKDVQELLGHADMKTTMNVYAHASSRTKRKSARLLDKMFKTDEEVPRK